MLCTLDSTDIEEQIATAEKTINNESAVESNTAKQNAQARSTQAVAAAALTGSIALPAPYQVHRDGVTSAPAAKEA